MKKTLYSIAIVVAIALFALSVTGCPDNDKPNNDPQNQAPTANAGTDFEHNITTSGTTVTLNGSGTDTDGTIEGYAWTCTDKPNGSTAPTFSNSAVDKPTVSGFDTLGDYEFSLKVKDNENKESTADVVKVSLCMTATKNVTVTFPALVSNALTLDFTPTYTPTITGGGFEDGDVVYTVTDNKGKWSSTASVFVVDNTSTSYYTSSDSPVVFTQTFKNKNDETLGSQDVSASVNPPGAFITLTPAIIPSIDITLSKKVTAGAITTIVDTNVEFVAMVPGATIDFSPSTALPDGVTYIVTDDSTPQKKWELYKDGFNGKITAEGSNADVTFTQTFYLYGTEITGTNSKRTVVVNVVTIIDTEFGSIINDSAETEPVTLKYP